MSGKKNLWVIIFTAVIISVFDISYLRAQNVNIIRWEPVQGAGGYNLEIRDSKKKIITEKEITGTTYDVSKFSSGNYQYRLTTLNKLQRKGKSTGWIGFTIEKAVIPVLIKVSQGFLSNSSDNPPVIITGENFLADTKLYLKKESEKIELISEFMSTNELKVFFKSENKITGIYDLVAVNRGGFETVLSSAIEIKEPVLPVVEALPENKIEQKVEKTIVEKVKTDPAGLLGFDLLTAGAGWDCGIPAGGWSSKLNLSFTGFHLYLSYPLLNIPYTTNIPFLKRCGAEVLFNYADYNFANGTSSDRFNKTAGYAGLNYPLRPDIMPGKMILLFNIDAGTAYSSMSYNYDKKHIDYSSLDFAMNGGLSLRYKWLRYYFTDLSVEYSRVFYISHPFDEVKISFRAGVML